MDITNELASTALMPAPPDTAVVRISVRPGPGAAAAGAVLVATLLTGPPPGTRHTLGRFSLYPADAPGVFLLRLDAAARRALRETGVPPRLVLSVEAPSPAGPAGPASGSPAAAWQITADWLPEPRGR